MSNPNERQLSSALNPKLRLKKIEMSSKSVSPTKVDVHQTKSEEELKMQEKSCNDDSLKDFKTPKHDVFTRSRVQKMRPTEMTNAKAKSMKRHNKERNSNKQILVKKELSNNGQLLIESSFFKEDVQNNAKLGHMCPLCFKILKNATAQALHMKTCAAKNNISTKKLFEAKELQERQAAERASLGLLSAPILQDKKKSVPRRTNLNENSDLELALALSKSLHEHADIRDLKDLTEHTSRIARDDCNGTLQTFGFMNKKPITVKRKGKKIGRTVLQTRNQAERERLLTEKIAEVLMTDDTVTQVPDEEISNNEKCKERVIVKSQRLRKIQQIEQKLWDKTRLSPNQKNFYVKSLSPYITKHGKESSKLSPLHDNCDMTTFGNKEYRISETNDIPETPVKTTVFPIDDNDIDSSVDNHSSISVSEKTRTINEHKFITSLISDWSDTLNNSAMSDIVIFVKEKKHIWTHRLVFSVRCSNILLDVNPNDDVSTSSAKEMIHWLNVPYSAALAFLEFIYCGTVKVNSQAFRDENCSLNLRYLARKYKVKDMFNYLSSLTQPKVFGLESPESICAYKNVTTPPSKLNLRRSVSEITIEEYSNLHKTVDKTSKNVYSKIDATSLSADENYNMMHLKNADTIRKSLSQRDSPRTHKCLSRESSVSPDLFDDTNAVNLHDTIKSNNILTSGGTSICNVREHSLGSINFHSRFSNSESSSPAQSKLSRSVNTRQKVQTEIGNTSAGHFSSPLPSNDLFNTSLVSTPKSSKFSKTEVALSKTNMKQKGNLTLFIERVQKENARSIYDSDSDMESVLQIRPKWERNPFNVNKYDDSICTPPNNKPQEQITKKRRHGLSKLEDEIRIDAIENPELHNLTSKRMSDEELDSTDATSSSTSRGMKRKTSNAINDTKKIQSSIRAEEINIEDKYVVNTISPVKTQRFSKGHSISDVDTEEDDISMYSKYKRKRVDNSIAKYRNLLKIGKSQNSQLNKYSTQKSSPTKEKTNFRNTSKDNNDYFLSNADADNIIVLSDWESDDSTTSTIILPKNNGNDQMKIGNVDSSEPRTSFSPKGTDTSNTDSAEHNINRAGRFEERDTHNITYSGTTSIDPNIYDAETDTETDSNIQKHQNGAEDISVHKIWPDNSINQRLNANHDTNTDREENYRSSSTGSPEVCIEPDDMGFNCFDILGMDAAINVDNIRYITEDVDKRKSYNSSSVSLSSSPKHDVQKVEEVNERRRASDKGIIGADDRINKSADSDDTKTIMSKWKKSLLCNKDKNTAIRDETNEVEIVRNSTPKRKNMKSNHDLFPKPEYIIIDRDVTPPPDYDSMPTPELHKNLKKYGLKLHKRATAVKLLSYIYDQLHPLVPIDAEEDDEANKNKMCVTKTRSVKTGSSENINIENECNSACQLDRSLSQSSTASNNSTGLNQVTKRNIEDPEIEQIADSDIGSATNVKEAFIRLARQNKQLYNKILTYEPLDIHALHAMLKAEGFKCKLNVLMNFLDEQCITFQLLEKNAKTSTRSGPLISKR